MITPIWMAIPPEMHSALLSTGPGIGPMLGAAQAWRQLSAEYSAAAGELGAILAQVQTVWQGPSSQRYLDAQLPMAEWLDRVGVNSATRAAQHELMAGAYSAALATMPTMVEIELNHAAHASLVATNFLGINTIPLALNEAEYAGMWVRAATAMETYDAESNGILAVLQQIWDFLTQPPLNIWDPAFWLDRWETVVEGWANMLPGLIAELQNVIQLLQAGDFAAALPALLQVATTLVGFIYLPITAVIGIYYPILQATIQTLLWTALSSPLWAPMALIAAAGLVVKGIQLLIELLLTDAPLPIANVAPELVGPRVSLPAVLSAPPSAPVPGGAGAGGPSAAPAGAGAPAPSAPAPAAPFVYALHFPPRDPGTGFDPVLKSRAMAAAPASGSSAAASESSSSKRRARRRRGAEIKERGYRDEYLTLDAGPDSAPGSSLASGSGAGGIGQARANSARHVEASGVITMAADRFGEGTVVPLLPGSWNPNDGQRDSPVLE